MATFAGGVGIVQAIIQGDKNIPFAQSATTGRSIVESSAGGLALDTTLTNTNTKLDTSNTHLNDLVNLNSSINAYSSSISLSTALSKDLQTTSNIYTNTTAVNTGVISTNTGTTATNTGTIATNTGTISTNTGTTATQLIYSNWLAQRTILVFSPAIAILSYGAFTVVLGPYDTYATMPIAPSTSVPYYNSIYVAGRLTAGNTTLPTLIFQFSNDNSSFFSEGINPVYSASGSSGTAFSLQRINIPTRYVRISTVAQSITIAGQITVTLQNI